MEITEIKINALQKVGTYFGIVGGPLVNTTVVDAFLEKLASLSPPIMNSYIDISGTPYAVERNHIATLEENDNEVYTR